MTPNDLEHLVIVENLKQYAYCPRITFYERCMPTIRPRTFSMDAGHDEHLEARQNARRRTFAQMGLEHGQREFDVDIIDLELGLRGKLDEVVTAENGEVIPVEYKGAQKVAEHHRLQVTAYAVLLERARAVTITRAYVYLIPVRKARFITITAEDRQRFFESLESIQQMTTQEQMPAPTPIRARCQACEFKRFCNDV
jgi:CRISPR-associated exonuclease Cas4